MSEEKLLPCPMCGGKAIKTAFSWGNICDEYTVKCTECGVGTKVLKSDEAVKSWNTRKPMENIVERLEKETKIYVDDDGNMSFAIPKNKAIEIVKGGVEDGETHD